jgi:uncharacterized protein
LAVGQRASCLANRGKVLIKKMRQKKSATCPETAFSFVVFVTERKITHQQKGKNMSTLDKKQAASIVWFEIPADNLQRAREFYGNLFGWKINPFPGAEDYWHIDTAGADETPDGALKKRKHPQEPITNYISVNSVTGFAAKIEKLGGKICMSKTAVPQMGYFAICQDTEGNTFAIWESDENAK